MTFFLGRASGGSDDSVVIVGAGVGGLATAILLAARGLGVTVVERAATPGGKMREVEVGGRRVDAGPTVLTLKGVFEELFAEAGASLADHVALEPAEVLARHAWDGAAGARLDLFADIDRSADAIAAFAGLAEGRRYHLFCERARRIWGTLERPFIRQARPSLPGLVGAAPMADLWRISPFTTMWKALGEFFHDPRLRQLFGRYATYCGSSPFLSPATLMLVAHVEQEGVWLVRGGMHGLAAAMAGLASRLGATLRYGEEVAEVLVERGRTAGVRLATGERLGAGAVVVNADAGAVAAGLLGRAAAPAVPAVPRRARSLSAVTWAMAAEVEGFPLVRHNVFFSPDYPAEFGDILERSRLPTTPTVYVCAQDRDDRSGTGPGGPERLLCLVNAPPTGDAHPFADEEIEACGRRTMALLGRCGLTVRPEAVAATTPAGFERLFPGTGGALYGRASHGWTASFDRPGARTKVPGLYLAGGSAHPGPGVPMAALSGRMAAACLMEDRASTARSRRTATRGGTSTA